MSWWTVTVGLLGFALLIGGVAWIYPPAGLIVAGALLLRAFVNLQKGTNARKPE